MVERKSVSIVIPNYNGEELLRTNLPNVIAVLQDFAAKHHQSVELVIVDDGSKDQSKSILSSYEKKKNDGLVTFTILYNEHNAGFSTTVNRGVEAATGDIVYLLNSDVCPEFSFLDPILPHFDDDTVFAVGSMDKSVEKDGVVLRGRGVGFWKRGFVLHTKGDNDKEDTFWVSGGSGAFRRRVWEKIGGLTELMNPFYWEDIDLSYRAQKDGYRLIFEPKSTVVHEHEKGAIKKSATSQKVQMTSYRNQFYFVWLNISDTSLLLSHVLWLPVHLIRACIRRDKAFLLGFLKALFHLPDILQRREKVQKLRKRSDRDVLRQFHS